MDGKESKWADIDDDEDDWAPETIEWNDGTKIDLSQNNKAAMLAEEQARAKIEKDRQDEEQKSKVAAQKKPASTVGPNATILKPRLAAQQKTGGVVLKASSDKPTLVAKPSAPAPVRSPWASLPPVDKVPPVDINPPSHPSTARPPPNEPSESELVAPALAPLAMEIAADDFTRTRRDHQIANLGQLYNAQSGQYEPANAGRRGSVRKDQNFRLPSLLQRGSQHDQQVLAEPSAAFQTQRSTSLQDNPLWTRRGSSIVSGDSEPQQRRESQPLISPSSSSCKTEQQSQLIPQSPVLHQSQATQENHLAARSPYQSRNSATDNVQSLQRDEVAAQKALMREKRELAIKRKKDEEEKEEAAKKERIRIKMEKLGMAPLENKKKKQEEKGPEKKQIEKKVVDGTQIETEGRAQPQVETNGDSVTARPQDLPSRDTESPPKSQVPTAPVPLLQDEEMATHAVLPNTVPPSVKEHESVDQAKLPPSSQKTSSPGLEPRLKLIEASPSPIANGVSAIQSHRDAFVNKAPDVHNENAVREPAQQPWNKVPKDQTSYGGWGTQSISRDPPASNSVWGPISQSRTLGNGTFDRSSQRPQSKPQDQFVSPSLAPIGPPRHLQRAREATDLRANDTSPAPIVEDFQTIPTFPPSEAPIASSSRANTSDRSGSSDTHISSPQTGTGIQLRSHVNKVERPSRDFDQHQASLNAWGNFKVTEAEMNRQVSQQHAARLADEARSGMQRPTPQLPIMNETWRQVKVDEQNAQRQVVSVTKVQNTHDRMINAQTNGDIRKSSFMGPTSLPSMTAAGIGRGSRFFPVAGTGMLPQYQGALRFPTGYRRSSSPPPPEDDLHSHPAYARDPMRPLVKLPVLEGVSVTEDTTPKVRLPPKIVTSAQSPQMSEARVMPFRAASQPLVNNPSWQDRFNGLLGVKKTSPEGKHANPAGAFSATKVPLDLPSAQLSASVSLPPQHSKPISRILETTSKLVEDEEGLFENREFGSLPSVTFPAKVPEVGWMDAKTLKRGQSKYPKQSKEVEATSKDSFVEKEMVVNGRILIFVKMEGMELSKSVPMPRSSPQTATYGASRQRHPPGNSRPNKGYRSRESSTTVGQGLESTHSIPPRSTPSNSLHTQPRSQQSKNHPVWGARTASVVH